MHCEECGDRELTTFVLIPKPRHDGALDSIVCTPCAIASGLYCEVHGRPHIGFVGGTHACIQCIEDDVLTNIEEGAAILERLAQSFESPHLRQIQEYLEETAFGDPERQLVRCVATLARRAGVPFTDMRELALDSHSSQVFTLGAVPQRKADGTVIWKM